ncbi:MAG: hypothetical protein AAF738_11610, partial [Bacteroidota bacterium]
DEIGSFTQNGEKRLIQYSNIKYIVGDTVGTYKSAIILHKGLQSEKVWVDQDILTIINRAVGGGLFAVTHARYNRLYALPSRQVDRIQADSKGVTNIVLSNPDEYDYEERISVKESVDDIETALTSCAGGGGPSGNLSDGNKGDVTVSGNASSFTINNGVVTDTKLANMPANTVKVRSGTSGSPTNMAVSSNQLVGRGSSGGVAPISLGTGLSMSGNTLNSTGGGSVTVQDEGSTLTTAATSFNFIGTGVTATNSGGAVTVNVPGGSGGSAMSTYDAGNGVTVHGTAGITASTVSSGVQTITIPSGGTLVYGQSEQAVASATYSLGGLSSAFRLVIDDSANTTLPIKRTGWLSTYDGNTAVSANAAMETGTNPTLQNRSHQHAGGISDIVTGNLTGGINGSHNTFILSF